MFESLLGERRSSGWVQNEFWISRNRLRYWEAKGIIRPELVRHGCHVWRAYDPDTIQKIRRLLTLLDEGLTLQGALRKLPVLVKIEQEAKEKESEAGQSVSPIGTTV